ncbi:glycosyltransferase family 4 protein [Neorhodopirellula pilleata]|uniref:Putative glycosyl transferase n=1 Tax=Neorhodopirellula pilleata TaxID=2714738 RepID=A0A5C6AAW1_9BACT|nr:glycosyltransferase family 4 protein [Neorhodopirellula pilleata]TWT96285.1 putative glycosyl transferase [Neorhodopirellula pilleata]
MPKIIIVSGIQLANNPRVVKEANALSEAGFDVEVLGAILSPEAAERDEQLCVGKAWRYTPVVDNRNTDALSRLRWIRLRMRSRLAREAYQRFGHCSVSQLGYAGPQMLRICRERSADLYSIHLEQALWVGCELLKLGKRVSVDFEDYYSEDLLPKDRLHRPVVMLQACERMLHQQAEFKLTTSESLADALQEAYGGDRALVIPNTFPWKERQHLDGKQLDRQHPNRLSVFWFSQTLGPQRGLEDLMAATHHIQADAEIHLRGNCSAGFREQLLSSAATNYRDRIFIHRQCSHRELISRIAEHDIGFAGETAYCPSRDLTITNKVLQYLQAGVPLVASNTSGQREVQRCCPDGVQLYEPGDAKALAAAIDRWSDADVRTNAARAALSIAETEFNWERTSAKLVKAFTSALESAG